MKKLFLTFIVFLMGISASAQIEHFKFMGIPLNGKISNFNREILKKGFKLEPNFGKDLPGAYLYDGVFAGETAQLFINYDEKTQNVYEAVVMIKRYSIESAKDIYDRMCDMIEEKYSKDENVLFFDSRSKEIGNGPYKLRNTYEENGEETTIFFIPSIVNMAVLGAIQLSIREINSRVNHDMEQVLFIKYTDSENNKKQEENKIDDL